MNIPMTAGTTTLAKVRTRIKVCGLTRIADAEAAVMHGADALGLIFWKPSPRYLDPLAAQPLRPAKGRRRALPHWRLRKRSAPA